MKTIAAILLGKLILFLSRFFKLGGGSAAPGLYALKIDKNLVEQLAGQIPKTVIVTGTNGKTTTAKILDHFVKENRIKIIRNSTGSNLERGLASTLISHTDFLGNLKNVDLAIWELDEAAFNLLAPKLNPDMVVFLNAFRDQLDRYGEVDTVVANWCKSLKRLKKDTTVVINGDDGHTASLKNYSAGETITFGLQNYKIAGEKNATVTSLKLDIEAKDIKNNGLSGTQFNFLNHQVKLPIPGIYQIYNFLAASIVAQKLGVKTDKIVKSIVNFSAAFGRVEKVTLQTGQEVFILLIKNPVGATQVFQTISPNLSKDDVLLIALNDNLADGTDVSWIWDGDFELLDKPVSTIIISGKRASDLAVRLKYAGLNQAKFEIEPDLTAAFDKVKTSQGKVFVLPTYTAMLDLQNLLAKKGIKKHYWRET